MKSAKGVTHVAKWKALYKADEAAVVSLTGMSYSDLMNLKADMGKQWLTNYAVKNCGYTKEDAAEMWVEPSLLRWWDLEWRRTDHFVIIPVLYRVEPQNRWEMYSDMHLQVFQDHHPNYKMLEYALKCVLERMLKPTKMKAA